MTGSINPELPGSNEDREVSDSRVKGSLITLRDALNGLLTSENKVAAAALDKGVGAIKYYTPKVIATEESRTNTAFGTLTTPDEIKGVVVPENGLLLVGYTARAKAPANAGRIAIFLGANQLKTTSLGKQEVSTSASPEELLRFTTSGVGLVSSADGADASTGQLVGSTTANDGGFSVISAAAATYDLSIQFKSSSGAIAAKERKLWVAVFG